MVSLNVVTRLSSNLGHLGELGLITVVKIYINVLLRKDYQSWNINPTANSRFRVEKIISPVDTP